MLTVILGLLFSVGFRVDKKKNYGQSIEQFMITQSTAGSDDQIIHHGKDDADLGKQLDITQQQERIRLGYQRQLYDGLNYYDPTLLHPIVHKLCCCPEVNNYNEEENNIQAEMR